MPQKNPCAACNFVAKTLRAADGRRGFRRRTCLRYLAADDAQGILRALLSPVFLKAGRADWRTIAEYHTAVERWCILTGDPPLAAKITLRKSLSEHDL